MTPDVITELDVDDPEVAEFAAWAQCAECGDPAPAWRMIRQFHGGYLCGRCDRILSDND